jgi:hypothetical protein
MTLEILFITWKREIIKGKNIIGNFVIHLNRTKMTIINTDNDLAKAFQIEDDCIVIPNDHVALPMLIAGRVHMGFIPEVVLNKLKNGGHCSIAVGDGVMLSVDSNLATDTIQLLNDLDKQGIELDVEDSIRRKINLYYRH